MAATEAEKQPLLAEEGNVSESCNEQLLQEPDDSATYDPRKLLSFEVITDLSGTVWQKRSLWKMMFMLNVIMIIVAIVVALVVSEPEKLEVARFQKISTFLKVIVGLLLGFFLHNSVDRWYKCNDGFLELFDSIRALQMQLNALGVPKERVHLCMRYCIISAHCVSIDLVSNALPPDARDNYKKEKYAALVTTDSSSCVAWQHPESSLAKIYEEERVILRKLEDPAQTLWVWITSLLSRMAADGEIPPMPSPTYGRIIALAETANSGIRMVRASVAVQPPYVHVQMMATLVNVNNIICTISFGLSSGVTLSGYLRSLSGVAIPPAQLSAMLQDWSVGFILAIIGPFLYQALLEVAVCIAQPFADAGVDKAPGRISTEKLLYSLEKDLRDAELFTKILPWWTQPYFKAPAPSAEKK
eukprot:TRINITY_DN107611_c0_g1_i1.p1 TRINITY_DN107611_c0_g1~~TRINITY_DN107611_c0_g1_i1.p1  ORF type:complete len:415 (-),score=98.33 TRINITY_DN107611_c0_g1_i1:19-1263(-)